MDGRRQHGPAHHRERCKREASTLDGASVTTHDLHFSAQNTLDHVGVGLDVLARCINDNGMLFWGGPLNSKYSTALLGIALGLNILFAMLHITELCCDQGCCQYIKEGCAKYAPGMCNKAGDTLVDLLKVVWASR